MRTSRRSLAGRVVALAASLVVLAVVRVGMHLQRILGELASSLPAAPLVVDPGPTRTEAVPVPARAARSAQPIALGAGATSRGPRSAAVAPCPPELRLSVSAYDPLHPRRSYAAVHHGGGMRVIRAGQQIGDYRLTALGPLRALLTAKDGTPCTLRVQAASRVLSRATSPRGMASTSRRALSAAELDAGIRELGSDHFGVRRELLEKALSGPAMLRQGARYRLEEVDGRVVGLKLLAVRKNSPLARLGVRPGDVIRNLNGLSLSEPGGALEAMRLVRAHQRFSLALLRDGAPRTLHYSVE